MVIFSFVAHYDIYAPSNNTINLQKVNLAKKGSKSRNLERTRTVSTPAMQKTVTTTMLTLHVLCKFGILINYKGVIPF
jgi:hypothetical protein